MDTLEETRLADEDDEIWRARANDEFLEGETK
jgi:hypothetical protein